MDNADVRIPLEELKAAFDRQRNRISLTREIAKTLLSSTTLIFSIVVSFTAVRGTSSQNLVLYNGVVIGSVLLFMGLIGLAVYLLLPAGFVGPMEPTHEVIKAYYFDKKERDVLLQQLSGYVKVIKENDEVIRKRNKLVVVMGSIMVLVFLAMGGLILIR